MRADMIANLFKNKDKKKQKKRAPSIPEGKRIYAIGDVHGCKDLLEKLLKKIDKDNQKRGEADIEIIFLGDLIDRGPDSAGVLDLCLALKKAGKPVRFLMGNHEEVYLKALTDHSTKMMRFFLRIGGEETLLSYDILKADFLAMDIDELCAYIPQLVPQEHIDFVQTFEEHITIGDYMFVHAGVKPGVDLQKQKPDHLRWIRDDFIDHKGPYGKIIIFGHTIFDEVREKPNHIGLDTGAYKSGVLTAIALEGNERWYLKAKNGK